MKILLGLSGGLDSAYSVKLLRDMGHEVSGAVLVMHDYTDVESAKSAARELALPLEVIDCRKAFELVRENLINEYVSGRTPNPCVICNREVKFKYLYEYAKSHGFDKIATGHYAKIENGAIYMASDRKKDQSYMLWRLQKEIISDLLCPLGKLTKDEIRKDAARLGLSSANAPESQEICFIPDGDYARFIENRRGKSPEGNFIDKDGKILGKHRGIIRYTLGQRKGLGVATGSKMFVTKINPQDNTVTLSEIDEKRDSLSINDVIFSSVPEMTVGDEKSYLVKLRYAHAPTPARVCYLGNGRMTVTLDTPQRAITPGQSAVFYDGERLAFGGFIE